MGTPNLCGFYYRMTDLVASQLYHLSDIVKDNSAIRDSNLEDTFTVTLKLSEDGVGSVQGVQSPRTKTKFKKKILRTNMVMSKAVRVSWLSGVRLQILLTTPLSSMLWLMRMTTGPCQYVPRFWTFTGTCSTTIFWRSMVWISDSLSGIAEMASGSVQ